MQMVLEASAQEAAMSGIDNSSEEQKLMERAIQESMRENPNPDLMNYEQLSELSEQIGSVKRGYPQARIDRLRPRANFDYIEDCPICIDKMEIA